MTSPLDDLAATVRDCIEPSCDNWAKRLFCESCEQTIGARLRALPAMYDQLHRLTSPDYPTDRTLAPAAGAIPRRAQSERVSGSRTPPLPPGSAGFASADDLLGFTLLWEDNLRVQLRLPDRVKRGRWGREMDESTWFLSRHILALLEGPDAAEFGQGVLAHHRRAERALGDDELVHRLPVRCGECETLALVRRDGEGFVRCTCCHTTYAEAQYDWFARVQAESMPAVPERQRKRPAAAADGTDARIGAAGDLHAHLADSRAHLDEQETG